MIQRNTLNIWSRLKGAYNKWRYCSKGNHTWESYRYMSIASIGSMFGAERKSTTISGYSNFCKHCHIDLLTYHENKYLNKEEGYVYRIKNR